MSGTSSLRFLFDDGEIFAVYKPAGIHSVIQSGSSNPSIAAELLNERPLLATVAATREDAGLINRLDHDTSGILLGASTHVAWLSFSKLLKSGAIAKLYNVILEGNLGDPRSISGWIGSPYRRGSKVRVYEARPPGSVRALPATTELAPVRFCQATNTTLAEVCCPVARRHQVRAHCSALGHPLLGDSLYGASRLLSEVAPSNLKQIFFLHAGRVEFIHPCSGEKVIITAAIPAWVAQHYGLHSSAGVP